MNRFKRLETSQIPSTALAVLIGKRGTGKTVLMKNLAYHMFAGHCKGGEEIHMAIVFSPTECMQHVFSTFVPQCFIYSEYREDVIAQLLTTQRELIERNGHTKTVLLILDDLGYNKQNFTSKTFRELVMNGRHCKILVMFAVQYVIDIPTAIRGNVDLTFTMADNSGKNRERLWENSFGQVPKREFSKLFEELTRNHQAMVSMNNNNSSRLEDTVYWYKADPDKCPKQFMFGLPIFWKMHDWCSGGEGNLPSGFASKPPGPPPPPSPASNAPLRAGSPPRGAGVAVQSLFDPAPPALHAARAVLIPSARSTSSDGARGGGANKDGDPDMNANGRGGGGGGGGGGDERMEGARRTWRACAQDSRAAATGTPGAPGTLGAPGRAAGLGARQVILW